MALSTIPTRALTEQGINFRNLIINGDMSIAQRGTSVTSISTEGYKTVDRFKWTMDTTSSVYTLSQSTDVPSGQGFANSFKADTTTADASLDSNCQIRFEHRFEGQNVQHLKKGTSSAESLTLSFWVKAHQTGTYVVNIQDTDNSRLIAKTYTVNSSDTWEKKTITFDGDTTGTLTYDNNLSLVVHWYLSAGSTYTSGTLATSWESLTNANRAVGQTVDIASSTSNNWYITGVQLEVGTSASDFEFLPYDVNFQRCARYYQVSGNNTNDNATIFGGYCFALNTSELLFCSLLPYRMRTGGTASITGTLHHRRDAGTVDITTIIAQDCVEDTISVAFSGSFNTGEAGYLRKEGTDATTSLMEVDAEL